MAGYTFFPPCRDLAGVVEAIWHADFPDPGATRSLVLPLASPILCFHYRSARLLRLESDESCGGSGWIETGMYRMTGVSSRVARLRPSGPVGGVMVRLRPEAAARLNGLCVRDVCDAAVALPDVFSPRAMSLLDEMLHETFSLRHRVEVVQAFLLRHLRDDEPDRPAAHAARLPRRNPALDV